MSVEKGSVSTDCVPGELPSCGTSAGEALKHALFAVFKSTVYILELSGSFNLRQSSSRPNNLLKYRAFCALVFSSFNFLFWACAVISFGTPVPLSLLN